MQEKLPKHIRAIIGLGNPGAQYYHHRHTIGFRVLDKLTDIFNGTWRGKGQMEIAEIQIHGQPVILVKPQTFMNSSGNIIPELLKKGIKAEEILVVHDELELPFGIIKLKQGGSHKGHNGLKSIIQVIGPDFWRLRYGIGRPENREDVPHYVLTNFAESRADIDKGVDHSIDIIEAILKKKEDK